MIRVLVVDDAPAMQAQLVALLEREPDLQVAGRAASGAEAVALARACRPDVVTMDLHLPGMDGFAATRRIMESCPVPVVVISGHADPAEVEAGFRALEAGALQLVPRPHGPGHPQHAASAALLVRTVRALAEVKVVRRWARAGAARAAARPPAAPGACRLAVLGASTGGPAVLRAILAALDAPLPFPLLLVQHLAPGFAAGLADWLARASGYPVALGQAGRVLQPGCAYLAPDGWQCALGADLRLQLLAGPPEHGMCPAVSHVFRTLPPSLAGHTCAGLLTGMGKDGARELAALRAAGALTVVQDRASSAVYGMPGEALRQDAATLVLAPHAIGRLLARLGREPMLALPDG